MRYLNRLRINEACELLMFSDLTVTDICYRVGFNNLSNFNRQFLAMKQVPPSRFRALHRLNEPHGRDDAPPATHAAARRQDASHVTFLGIDLGTSAVKVLLTDSRSAPLATGSAALSISRPHPHWSEQAQAWWHAMLDAIAAVRAAHPAGFAALRGIALSGQMHGATLIDRADRCCARDPVERHARRHRVRRLEALVPESRAITGNMAMPGFTAPKLLWLAKYGRRVPRGARAAAEGLPDLAPVRRIRVRDVRRVGHAGSTAHAATGPTGCSPRPS